jgi:hypothetical protein
MSEIDQNVVKGLVALRGAATYTGALYEMGKMSLTDLQKSLTSVLVSVGLVAVAAPPQQAAPQPQSATPEQPTEKPAVPQRDSQGRLIEPFSGRTRKRPNRTKAVNFNPNVERILELCVLGKSNNEIGKLTNTSPATVYRIRNRSANVSHHFARIDAFLVDHPGVDLHRGDRPAMSDQGRKNIADAMTGHIPWNKGLRGVKSKKDIKG